MLTFMTYATSLPQLVDFGTMPFDKASGRLSLAYHQLTEVPPNLIQPYVKNLRELDLSYNNISDLSFLRLVPNLQRLILDGNKITEHTKWPVHMEKLNTLWVNKNLIENLTIFLDKLVKYAPNLTYLSMLNNEACPNYFNGGTLQQYRDYR